MASAGTPHGYAGLLTAYARLLSAQARGQAQYRASFVVDVAGSVLAAVADLVGVFVLFRVTRSLGGFGFREVLLIAGLGTFGFALAELTVGGIDRMRFMIRNGLVDALLVRPLSVFGQLVVIDFSPRRIGRVAVTGSVFVAAAAQLEIQWTPGRAALMVIAPVSAGILFASIFVATSTVAFWWIEAGEFCASVTYGGREFTTYPLTVYGGAARTVFGYGLGYAFASYHPALALLGREDPLGAPGWLGWASPAFAALAAAVAALAWRVGIRRYRSTGS